MNIAALYGLAAWALLVGAATTLLPGGRRLTVAIGATGFALAPLFAGESLAMMLHGAFAAPSFTLLQVAAWRVGAPGRPGWLKPRGAALLLLVALAFYPLALGVGPFDPYGLGYRPLPLLVALLPLAGWLAWRRHPAWLVVLGFDLFAYAAGFFDNLWDALFDPVLMLVAAAVLAISRPRPRRSAAGRW